MQLHMISDDEIPGGKKFGFWSRKAKEYTYLYGNGFEDPNSALTRHLKEAFNEGVKNIILDGEMITWDPEQDAMVPFGYVQFGVIPSKLMPRFESQSMLWEHKALLTLHPPFLCSGRSKSHMNHVQNAQDSGPRSTTERVCDEEHSTAVQSL